MADAKEFKVLNGDHLEKMLDMLSENSIERWTINTIYQEHGYTKVLLEREKK